MTHLHVTQTRHCRDTQAPPQTDRRGWIKAQVYKAMAYGLHFQRADAKQSLKILWHISKKYKRKKSEIICFLLSNLMHEYCTKCAVIIFKVWNTAYGSMTDCLLHYLWDEVPKIFWYFNLLNSRMIQTQWNFRIPPLAWSKFSILLYILLYIIQYIAKIWSGSAQILIQPGDRQTETSLRPGCTALS